jgi:DNA transposition AAA+ family ATPase
MEVLFKQKVSESFNRWLEENPETRSINKVAEELHISRLYVSRIKNGIYQIEQKDAKPTEIRDEFFHRIAELIGLTHRSHTGLHWETSNFKQIQKVCRAAQNKRMRVLLQADTGHGKTYALDHYQIHNDKVIYLKVTRSMTERNLLEAILRKLGIKDIPRGNREKINLIRFHLTGTPGYLLIIDEAEYLRPALFHVIKEIADFTEGKCGFIMSGFALVQKIGKLADKKREGFPQLKRRFFPNRIMLPEKIENSEKRYILQESGITDATAINVIIQYADDFDMLSQMVSDIVGWQKSNGKKMNGQEVMTRFRDSIDI